MKAMSKGNIRYFCRDEVFSDCTCWNIHVSVDRNDTTSRRLNANRIPPFVFIKPHKYLKSNKEEVSALVMTIESENVAALKNENEKSVKPKVKSMLRLL